AQRAFPHASWLALVRLAFDPSAANHGTRYHLDVDGCAVCAERLARLARARDRAVRVLQALPLLPPAVALADTSGDPQRFLSPDGALEAELLPEPARGRLTLEAVTQDGALAGG